MDFTCIIMQKIPSNYTNNFVKLSRCLYISYTKIPREHVYIISNVLIMCKPTIIILTREQTGCFKIKKQIQMKFL